jgi:hypothetical protein
LILKRYSRQIAEKLQVLQHGFGETGSERPYLYRKHPGCGYGMSFREDQRAEMEKVGPAWQEVSRRGLEFPGRASGQQEAETAGIFVIQILDFVQGGRHLLDLIHAYNRRAAVAGL